MRGLCESDKKGERCIDDLCRGADITLCGFDADEYEEMSLEFDDDGSPDDCMECGQCDLCLAMTKDYFEEMERVSRPSQPDGKEGERHQATTSIPSNPRWVVFYLLPATKSKRCYFPNPQPISLLQRLLKLLAEIFEFWKW
jgi:hypothetical protein